MNSPSEIFETLREAELAYEISQLKLRIKQLEYHTGAFMSSLKPVAQSGGPLGCVQEDQIMKISAHTALKPHPRLGKVLECRSFPDGNTPFYALYQDFNSSQFVSKRVEMEAINHTLVNFQRMMTNEYKEML